jgi:hypothetical protein
LSVPRPSRRPSRGRPPSEDGARLRYELAEARLGLGSALVLELDAPHIAFKWFEQGECSGISPLDDGLDGRRHGVDIRVREKPGEQLRHARLRHLRQQVRQLRQRRAAFRKPMERALHTERHLFEAVESETGQGLAGGMARLGLIRTKNIDEQVDDPGTLQVTEHFSDSHQAQRRFVLVEPVDLKRVARGPLEHRDDTRQVRIHELVVRTPRRALRIEQRGQRRVEIGLGHFEERYPRDNGLATHAYYRHISPAFGAGLGRFVVAGSFRVDRRHEFIFVVPITSHAFAAASVALLSVLALGAGTPVGHADRGPTRSSAPVAAPTMSPCPSGTLPDVDLCVHVPADDAPAAESVMNAHRDIQSQWIVYDQIPRRPDRPAEYAAYRYPVTCEACVVSGYDLDQPDERQRRGRRLRQVGHGAIDLAAPRAAPVELVELEHQQGPADLVYVGPLFGTTVVTRHRVREANESRDYIVILGHLEAAAPGLIDRPDSPLRNGQLLGYVGDSGSPGLVHLHLEVRRVREGVDAKKLAPATLVDGSFTVVCDPRNLLPLK